MCEGRASGLNLLNVDRLLFRPKTEFGGGLGTMLRVADDSNTIRVPFGVGIGLVADTSDVLTSTAYTDRADPERIRAGL